MVRTARAHDVKPIFLYFPLVTESQELWRTADRAEVLELARAAGFDVMDLNGAYGHVDPSRLWIALNDVHPNALGSQLLADKAVDVWSRQFARTAAGR
jgi:hypothetical protein